MPIRPLIHKGAEAMRLIVLPRQGVEFFSPQLSGKVVDLAEQTPPRRTRRTGPSTATAQHLPLSIIADRSPPVKGTALCAGALRNATVRLSHSVYISYSQHLHSCAVR
mgnify:CR=1 FL=1